MVPECGVTYAMTSGALAALLGGAPTWLLWATLAFNNTVIPFLGHVCIEG